jgi:hypothetical protein
MCGGVVDPSRCFSLFSVLFPSSPFTPPGMDRAWIGHGCCLFLAEPFELRSHGGMPHPDPETITRLALLTLEKASHDAKKGVVERTWGIRLALALP